MGWEQRGNNQYYYKKEREGSKVKSVYVGCGDVAHMVAQIQSTSLLLERLARSIKSPQALEQERAEAALDLRVECWATYSGQQNVHRRGGFVTTPPNSCEGGVGVGATTYGIPIPMLPLRPVEIDYVSEVIG